MDMTLVPFLTGLALSPGSYKGWQLKCYKLFSLPVPECADLLSSPAKAIPPASSSPRCVLKFSHLIYKHSVSLDSLLLFLTLVFLPKE